MKAYRMDDDWKRIYALTERALEMQEAGKTPSLSVLAIRQIAERYINKKEKNEVD